MSRLGSTIKSYVFWTYERGSMQYDVMVTLILAFIFLSPRFLDFHDKPAYLPSASGMVSVRSVSPNTFVCDIDPAQLPAGDSMEGRMVAAVEPILGTVSLQHYETESGAFGRTISYRVWVSRK